jgi:hypothetical protein
MNENFLPFINVYRNLFCILFPDKAELNTQFGIDLSDFYLIVKLAKISDGTNLVYKGHLISTPPTTKSDGLNQIDLCLDLENGVYSLTDIEIVVNEINQGSIGNLSLKQNMLFNVPSINQYDTNMLIGSTV